MNQYAKTGFDTLTAGSSRTAGQRRQPGRPRLGDAQVVRGVLVHLVAAGVEWFTVPELIATVMARVPCSRRTAYRLVRRACDEGAIELPGFGTR